MNISDKTRTFRNPKVWIPVSAVIVLILASLLFWITTREDDVTYMTEKVRTGNISQVVEATGEVAAVNLVSVGAQVSGQIKKLYVVLGQEVKQGEMIAKSIPRHRKTLSTPIRPNWTTTRPSSRQEKLSWRFPENNMTVNAS